MALKDVFYDVILNPNLTLYDFTLVGHSATNSVLKSADEYKKNPKIVDHFTTDGVFNEDEFNKYYQAALYVYGQLTDTEVNDHIMRSQGYSPNNIWVAPLYRTKDLVPTITFAPNPDRTTESMYELGYTGPRTQSIDEIAQSLKVLLNPVQADKNPNSAEWGDPVATLFSRPGKWMKDLFKPKVLAAWDSDGTHIDPITGETVEHTKGLYKLNNNGTYYYEELDGREIYGKQILSPLNTITTDGTRANQFDFFDSDDIQQKSVLGSIMKYAVLVGSMYIPYIGWGIAGASVLGLSVGLFGALGKLLTGLTGENANSEVLNWMEAFSREHNRSYAKTEEAQQRPWCLENIIGLVGDVAAQLRELRAIFKFAPAVFKGKWGIDLTEAGTKAFLEAELKALSQKLATDTPTMRLIFKALGKGGAEAKSLFSANMNATISSYANHKVLKYLSSYNEIGEQIARLYMTAVTVLDTYGEAIEAGASPIEAAALTLGYAAMENKLLKSDIGRWIYPELRADKVRFNAIKKVLTPEIKAAGENIANKSKQTQHKWFNTLFEKGKKLASLDYSTGKTGIGMAVANGLAEGFEEVSEEALADFSKGCYNLYKTLTGDLTGNANTRLDDLFTNFNFKDDLSRYALNFIGGFGGGAVNSASINYKALKSYKNMNEKEALGELIHMHLNGTLQEFIDWLDKSGTGGNRWLSTKTKNGLYLPGTDTDNQELANRTAIKNQINMITTTLEAEKANLDDNSVLKIIMQSFPELTLQFNPEKDFRYNAFANSQTAGAYLKHWNKVCQDLVVATNEVLEIEHSKSDAADEDTEYNNKLKAAQAKLKVAQDEKERLLKGEDIAEFMKDVLFETNFAISANMNPSNEIQYAEWISGVSYNELTDELKKQYKEDYKTWSLGPRADQIHDLATMYWNMQEQLAQRLTESLSHFEELSKGLTSKLRALSDYAQAKLETLNQVLSIDTEGADPIELMLTITSTKNQDFTESERILVDTSKYEEEITKINEDLANKLISEDEATRKKKDILFAALLNTIVTNYLQAIEEIAALKFITPEIRNILLNDISKIMVNAQLNLEQEGLSLNDIDYNNLETFANIQIPSLLNQILDLPNTPIVDMLSKFSVGIDNGLNLVQVIDAAINISNANADDLSNLLLLNTDIKTFKSAIKFLLLFRSVIAGARYDSADLSNLSGNTRTLNAISKGEAKYAEIDKNLADLASIDIDMAIDRLEFLIGVHDLNSGNKLVVQQKVALNSNYIYYLKMQRLFGDVDDDRFAPLKQTLNNMPIHNSKAGKTVEERQFNITPEERLALEAENIALGDVIYDFFQLNPDLLTTENLLKVVFKDLGEGLFKYEDNILTANTETVSDISFVWWLASKVALRSSDFYATYKNVITDKLAPIPTQEIGIFSAVASILNGKVFDLFTEGLSAKMMDYWTNLSEDLRTTLAKTIKAEYAIQDPSKFRTHDLIPLFSHIQFIEGIPGSGKSKAIITQVLNILEYSNPSIYTKGQDTGQHLLDNGYVMMHSTIKNAKDAIEEMAISDTLKTKAQCFDKESGLLWMSSEYTPNPTNEAYYYIEGLDVTTANNELHSLWKLNELSNVPKVIFIDEWSRYTLAEIDLINRFCAKYSCQVIAAGDLDQLTPKAWWLQDSSKETREATETGDSRKLSMSVSKYMTPHVVKLGVSMRSGNGQMSISLETMQAWYRNYLEGKISKTPIKLRYTELETGLYGVKTHLISDPGNGYSDTDILNILSDISKLVSTLKEDEKIGYIYSDVNSKLYKAITTNAAFENKIEYYTEQAAQGRESRYYIVEPDRNLNDTVGHPRTADEYFHSLYTGMSRASQGAIVITRLDSFAGLTLNTSLKDDDLIPDSFTAISIKTNAEKRRSILNNLQLPDKPLIAIDRESTEIVPIVTNQQAGIQILNLNPLATPTPNPTIPQVPSVTATPIQPTQQPTPESPNAKFKVGLYVYPVDRVAREIKEVITNPDGSYSYRFDENAIISENDLINNLQVTTELEPRFEIGLHLYDTVTGFDYGIIQDINNQSINGEPIKYTVVNDRNEQRVFAETELTNAGLTKPNIITQYKQGDIVINLATNEAYQVNKITINQDGSITYTLHKVNANESDLEVTDMSNYKLLVEALLEADEDEDPADEVPYPIDTYTLDDFGDELELIPEAPSTIALNKNGNDITFTIAGESFLADEVTVGNQKMEPRLGLVPNNDGSFTISEQDLNRIDNGFGLYKLRQYKPNVTGAKPLSKNNMIAILSKIRSAAKYQDNSELADTIRDTIPELQGEEIKLKWAFVSRIRDSTKNSGLYTRYSKNWNEPLKQISLIVEVKQNGEELFQPVLEIPMITLESPFTILSKHKKDEVNTLISQAWDIALTYAKNIKQQTNQKVSPVDVLQKFLESFTPNSPGYLSFATYCRLWLETRNNCAFLPDLWSLAKSCTNLGNWFVKIRTTDPNAGIEQPFPYTETINSMLEEAKKRNVVHSEVLKTTLAFIKNGVALDLVPRCRPFVLRSDNLAYRLRTKEMTTEALVELFIKECEDSSLPKTIQVVLLDPPEINFLAYLEKYIATLVTKGAKNNYGNRFTALRLLLAINDSRNNADATDRANGQALWNVISIQHKPILEKILTDVAIIEKRINQNNTLKERIELKKEAAQAINNILLSQFSPNRAETVGYVLNNILLEMFYPYVLGEVSGRQMANATYAQNYNGTDRVSIMLAILDYLVPARYGNLRSRNTGILVKTKLVKKGTPEGELIHGFATRVEVDADNSYTLDGKPFTFFGKIDTAKFDLTSSLLQGSGNLTLNTIFDILTKNQIVDSLEFTRYYRKFGDQIIDNPFVHIESLKNPDYNDWIAKYSNILANTGFAVLNVIALAENSTSENEFINKVILTYISNPGKIGFMYGNLPILIDVSTVLNGEFANAKLSRDINALTQNGNSVTITFDNGKSIEVNLTDAYKGTYSLSFPNNNPIVEQQSGTNGEVSTTSDTELISQIIDRLKNRDTTNETEENSNLFNLFLTMLETDNITVDAIISYVDGLSLEDYYFLLGEIDEDSISFRDYFKRDSLEDNTCPTTVTKNL